MADSNRLLLSLLLALIFTRITVALETDDDVLFKPDTSDSSLKIELDGLKSKISSLESSIDDRTRELGGKHESIERLEKIIQEKSISIASLQSEIQSLQQNGTLDVKEQVVKAHERAIELEKKVSNLKKEMEAQNKKKDALEARANEAENKIMELNLKLETLQKINDEQKTRIRKTERALRVAEEEIVKAKLKATSIQKELTEVRKAWIPHWLEVHAAHCQSSIVTHWKERGRPALDLAAQKALGKKAQVEKWAEPHIETFKTEWIPIIKERWLTLVTNVEPYVQSLSAKTIEVYHACMDAIEPHAIKVQEMVDPYVQDAKKVTKLYIDQLATVTKPHVDKARVILKPYTKKALRSYKRFMKTASIYHHQVQGTIHESLKKHEFTKLLATKELVWFMASALMALPVLYLFKLTSAIFSKKPKKHKRTSHTSHTRRRAKRVHSDK